MGESVKILYEDDQVIVCLKPVGMPSQDDRSSAMDLESYLRNYVKQRNAVSDIWLIHRLDRPVSGVMVYAKTALAAKSLSSQIQKGRTGKRYYAVLTGVLKDKEGELTNTLLRDGRTNMSKIVPKGTPGGKEARLKYRVLRTKFDGGIQFSLVDVELITGRHHQIRVQMAGAGAGIYGDSKYNSQSVERGKWADIGLFSYFLEFDHPKTHKKMTFQAEPSGGIFQKFF